MRFLLSPLLAIALRHPARVLSKAASLVALGLSLVGGHPRVGPADLRPSKLAELAIYRSPEAARRAEGAGALPRQAGLLALARPGNVERVREGPAGLEWRTGTGAPQATLILLHGLGGSPDAPLFEHLVADLAAQGGSFRVVAPWLRTPGKPHFFGEELARAEVALARVRAEDPGPIVLIGHSLGGKAANVLAKEPHARVLALIELAPAMGLVRDRAGLDMSLPPAVLAATLSAREAESLAHGRPLEAEQWHYLADIAGRDERGLERDVRTRTLVVSGIHDALMPAAVRFAAENAGAVEALYVVDDHMLAQNRQIATPILAFIQAQLQRAAP